MFISVIIPTYRDWDRLGICLDALNEQSYSRNKFEIVVVNNDPSDLPPAGLRVPTNCQIVDEDKPGSYAARNKGVYCSVGDVLAFTDADCIPDRDWVKEISLFYLNSNSCLLAGDVRMFSVRREIYNFSESYDYIFGINQKLYVESGVAATANLAMLKTVFSRLGGFNPMLLSGGDGEFCQRALKEGFSLSFSQKVVVMHPLRHDFDNLCFKARRLVGGKIRRNRAKGIFYSVMPPLVRVYILVFKKEAPLLVKFKALCVLFAVKCVQVNEVFRVVLGYENERR